MVSGTQDRLKAGSGRDHMSIPGPSVMPDRVLRAMHRPAPNIYAGELVELTASLKRDLNSLAGNEGDVAIYIGNGHAVWEASLCNTFSRGDKALFLITGRFGLMWADVAQSLGVDAQVIDFGHKQAVDAAQVEAVLKEDTQHEIKAVLTVHTDTASSSSNDLAAIRQAIDNAQHPALYMVDSIASFACESFHMQSLSVDLMITASQKGLMTPPGIGLMFISEKYWASQKKADLVTPYWDAYPRVFPDSFPDNFNGTPPTHHLFGLREAVNMLQEEGIENTWHRHACLAKAVWAAVDAWGSAGDFACCIEQESMRSRAVTSIKTAPGIAKQLQDYCADKLGVIIGVGLAPALGGLILDDTFRIGHMGHVNAPMILGTLSSIEVALQALDIPHGSGAVDAAAKMLRNC